LRCEEAGTDKTSVEGMPALSQHKAAPTEPRQASMDLQQEIYFQNVENDIFENMFEMVNMRRC